MDSSGPGPGSGRKRKSEPGLDQDYVKSKAGRTPGEVFLKSAQSKALSIHFASGQSGPSQLRDEEDPSVPIGQEPQMDLDSIFQDLKKQLLINVEQQLQRIHRLMASDYPQCPESEEAEPSPEVLNMAVDLLKKMDQEQLAQRLSSRTQAGCRDKLKSDLQQRFSRVFEGVAKAGDSAPLTQIYTELYVTEGGASGVNQEHEVRHFQSASRRAASPEKTITCEDMFKARPHSPEPIRTVLMNGVAGVGKTVLTQKFSLDWAEGRANQDLQLLFPFTFRELNVLRDRPFSLVELLHHFFSPSKGLRSFQQLQVLFIFDGLDECRLPLDFSQTRVLTDPTESATVDVLLVNLIRGSLLPCARLWITTRPAAANQIPAECVSMVTEVQGFSDQQKEEYFRKRFRDEADTIISHIKRIRSLFIMCHIPIFCWILSRVIQKLLEQRKRPELPRTLTQMYVHFLVVQAKVRNIKYHQGSGADLHWTPETREMVQSLGKLAFEQLQKGNLIFYEDDLSECGLDAAGASVYSGVFTEVFREEPGLYQDKVYCFIHLSVQEFLAALHVHQTFFSSGQNLLELPHSSESPEADFYCSAVDQALQSPNGHLDLFLRFLLGLSLPTNQNLLQGLLTQIRDDTTNQKTAEHIKQKLNEEGLSAEKSLNLFHCLNELNDHSLVKEIQKKMSGGQFSDKDMSPAQWSAMCFLLLSSDSDLKEFDLRKYKPSETVLLHLLPVVKASTKALLIGCGLSPHSCGPLASVLSSSSLTLLDLSNNDLQDSGVELLCSGLKSATCRLETLRLSGCLVSERGGAALASALSSAHSNLRALDLSYNHPGPSAELLTALRDDLHCPLQSVWLDPAGERWMVPGLRKYWCDFSLDPNTAHRLLLLSEDHHSVTRVEEEQEYPDHEDRFTHWGQVLSATGLWGRCYWEVDWSGGQGGVYIAVSYRGIRRRGEESECGFGANAQSWILWISDGDYCIWHNNSITRLSSGHSGRVGVASGRVGVSSGKVGVSSGRVGVSSGEVGVSSGRVGVSSGEMGVSSGRVGVSSGRVGVFLDYEAGVLSFYEVSSDGGLSHIYTCFSSFSEPLFPGFGLDSLGDYVTVVNAKRQ